MRVPRVRFTIRRLMGVVAVVAVVLAIVAQAAAGNPVVIAGLILAVVLSIAWVPAVITFLPLVVARRILEFACLALLLSMTFAVYETGTGSRWIGTGLGYSLMTLWVTFACGLGYILAWARHDFRRRHVRLRLKRPGER